jgi:alanine dehydrogenase
MVKGRCFNSARRRIMSRNSASVIGLMQIRILSAADVRAAVDMPAAIGVMRTAFAALASGRANVPVRLGLTTEHGVTLFMPAHLSAPDMAGAKVVSVNPGNAASGLPVIQAVVLAIDPVTGRIRALMDGTWLTALRTGAVGGLAADLLARRDAGTVALFGAGVQARTQLEAVRCVRDIGEVRIVSVSGSSADELVAEIADTVTAPEAAGADRATGMADSVRATGTADTPRIVARRVDDPNEAIAGADIVIAATSSRTPVFDGTKIEPGTHVTGVGSFTPEMREVDTALVQRARVIVDQREAIMDEAGDIVGPIADGDVDASIIVGEIGEVVLGTVEGRRSAEEVTFFKSVGNAVQDVAVAGFVLEVAEREGLGVLVEM